MATRERLFAFLWRFAALLVLISPSLSASPWVITTDFSDRTIHTVDLGTDPPTVYGPFLGRAVAPAQVGAVKVLPEERIAIVAGAFGGALYFMDVTNPRL